MPKLYYHPLYSRHSPYWAEQRDAYLGGIDYLDPARGAMSFEDLPAAFDRNDTDSVAYARSLASTRSAAVSRPLPVRTYLQAHPRESNGTFRNRVAQAFFLRTGGAIVDLYAAYVGEAKASYGPGRARDPWLTALEDDATLTGQTLRAYVREQTAWAQVYGVTHTLVVRPGTSQMAPDMVGGQFSTAALRRQERPYLVPVHALDLVNWQVDSRGTPLWIVVAEHPPYSSTFGAEPPEAEETYLEVTRTGWQRWRRIRPGSPEIELTGEIGTNPLGEVPLVSYYQQDHSNIAEPIGTGRMATLAAIDRAIFNRLSEKTEYLRRWAFAQLAMQLSDLQKMKRDSIIIGNEYVLPYEEKLPAIIEGTGKACEWLANEVSGLMDQMRRLSGLSRGAAESSAEERSGVALRYEMLDKFAGLRQLALERERFERSLSRMVLRVAGVVEPADELIACTVSRDFDADAVAGELARVTELGKLATVAPVVIHALTGALERRALSDLDADARARLEAEAAEWHEAQLHTTTTKTQSLALAPTSLDVVVEGNEARAAVGLVDKPAYEGKTLAAIKAEQASLLAAVASAEAAPAEGEPPPEDGPAEGGSNGKMPMAQGAVAHGD